MKKKKGLGPKAQRTEGAPERRQSPLSRYCVQFGTKICGGGKDGDPKGTNFLEREKGLNLYQGTYF